jgi:5-methylcytosine-specific restriction endonuclease McrA
MISSAEGTARHGQTKTKTGKGIIRPASFDVLCDTCNQPFEMLISNRGDLQDKQKYLNGKHRMTCKECYAKANARYHQAWQQAEAERQRRLDELHTMPYREYLQSPEWQVTRKRAMKRAGFRCQICNAYGVRLNVHHRTYERRGYEENQDLIVLCEGCHSIFHENGSLARY